MEPSMLDESPEPRRGVMPRQPVPGPAASAVSESSGQYVARRAVHALDGGLFALLNARGVLNKVRGGLPYSMFDELVGAVGGSQRELAAIVGIPATTLARRKRSGTLTPSESDRLVRIARLAVMAVAMMHGDLGAAGQWLRAPHELLDRETPLARASTETGARDVEYLIGRLRHGVFS